MARILVIGGTRFIGAHAARHFADAGHEVTVFHRGTSDNPILPPSVTHVRDAAAEYPIVRFADAVARADWDVVVHMIMMGEADARVAADTFVGHAGRLVMISSGDVYRAYGRLTGIEPGEPDPVPLTEDAQLRSVFYPYRAQAKTFGAYARDYEKILAEQVTREAATPSVILRLPKVYGPEDNANLATVYSFAKQPQWRWTHGHVDNVAASIVLAATHPNANGIYNVGEAETPTMGVRLSRLPPRAASSQPPPPFDYRQSIVCDSGRVRRELGFREVVDERESMLQMANAAA